MSCQLFQSGAYADAPELERASPNDYALAMQLAELFDTLHALPRADKFRALQFLTSELAHEETGRLLPNAEYPVWSPYDATDAAETLAQYLRDQPKSE